MSDFPELPCFCGSLRRVERVVTRFYDHYLRSTGFGPSQITILMLLQHTGSLAQGELGQRLAMDKATMSRTLQPLLTEGLVQAETGSDRRVREISLTAVGRDKLKQILPLWKKANTTLQRRLGNDFSRLLQELNTLPERISS